MLLPHRRCFRGEVRTILDEVAALLRALEASAAFVPEDTAMARAVRAAFVRLQNEWGIVLESSVWPVLDKLVIRDQTTWPPQHGASPATPLQFRAAELPEAEARPPFLRGEALCAAINGSPWLSRSDLRQAVQNAVYDGGSDWSVCLLSDVPNVRFSISINQAGMTAAAVADGLPLESTVKAHDPDAQTCRDLIEWGLAGIRSAPRNKIQADILTKMGHFAREAEPYLAVGFASGDDERVQRIVEFFAAGYVDGPRLRQLERFSTERAYVGTSAYHLEFKDPVLNDMVIIDLPIDRSKTELGSIRHGRHRCRFDRPDVRGHVRAWLQYLIDFDDGLRGAQRARCEEVILRLQRVGEKV